MNSCCGVVCALLRKSPLTITNSWNSKKSSLIYNGKMDTCVFAIVRDCFNPDGSLVEISKNRKKSIKKASERRKDELHTKIEDDQKYLCVSPFVYEVVQFWASY